MPRPPGRDADEVVGPTARRAPARRFAVGLLEDAAHDRARRCAYASPIAERRMNPSIWSHGRDQSMRGATSHAVSWPSRIGVDDLDEPVLVVGADLEQAVAVADVAPLVRGQRLHRVVLRQPLERAEVVAERVGLGLRVEVDVGRDARQHAVAGEHEAVGRPPRSRGGRASGPGVQIAVRSQPGHVGLVAVLHEHVGLDDVDERPHRHRRVA